MTLELLDWPETKALARGLIAVSRDAYLSQLVLRQQLADADSVREYYNPDDPEVVRRFLGRTLNLHQRGGRITVLRSAPGSEELLGFSKIGPAPNMTRDGKGGYDFDGYYLNNVIVHPDVGRTAVGSTVLHAGFKLNRCDPDAQVVLDAIDGNEIVANPWYRRMGFVRSEVLTSTFDLEGEELPQTYYVAPSVASLMVYLEMHHPELQYVQPNFT